MTFGYDDGDDPALDGVDVRPGETVGLVDTHAGLAEAGGTYAALRSAQADATAEPADA